MSIYEAWFSLFGPVTGTEQIAVAVSALSDLFPTGLLILHDPAQGAYLFRSGLPATFLSFRETLRWHGTFTGTPVMLFTQSPGSSCGHFQHCASTTPTKTFPSSFRPSGFHWSMMGGGADDRLWPISPTIPFVAQASQSESVPPTQLETSLPVPSTQLETPSSPQLAFEHQNEVHPLTRSPSSNVEPGPASSPKRSGKHECEVGHVFDLLQCLCMLQADQNLRNVARSPEVSCRHTCQVCHAFHLVECLCLLPAGGNPSKATPASAACSIVQELDTDCGSSNVVPAPVSMPSRGLSPIMHLRVFQCTRFQPQEKHKTVPAKTKNRKNK